MALTAATLLGDNTRPILTGLAAHLETRVGRPVELVGTELTSSTDAARMFDEADLVWACGFLTVWLADTGALPGEVVAAPVFAGSSRPVYHSVLVCRTAERGDAAADRGRLVINEVQSWSGHHALGHHVAGRGDHDSILVSGSHRASLAAVASGQADVAAIDHTVWEAVRSTPATDGLSVFDRTREWPAPPFTVHHRLDEASATRLVDALAAVGPGDVVGVERIVPAGLADYECLRPAPLLDER